jgi:LCP family protein required for cell wall assembly
MYLEGGQLAVDTIQYNLGVRVDYYVLVEFDAFITLVDEIGGIDINVPYEIYDPEYPDMNYGYDPLYIPAGFQHMDGELALKYARTRHGDNDFERAPPPTGRAVCYS